MPVLEGWAGLKSTRKYNDLDKEELIRLLEARDRQAATRFGLVWEADEFERDRALNADFVALDLVPDQCCGDAPWRNLIIEGDNFDALRFLRMGFAGRVKCILIDPPYNTGQKDFVYNDRFVDKNDSWRFSKWVEFLYQRLIIARELLSEDGVLLCCINDENRAKLELLLDKVMQNRRLGSFTWRTKDSSNDADGNLSQVHEHVLIYANPAFAFRGKPISPDDYRNPDGDPRGLWTPQPLTKAETRITRPNTYYPIQDPETGYWYPCDPDRVWAYASETKLKEGVKLRSDTIEALIRKKEIYFPPCNAAAVMLFNGRAELLAAVRAGKGPILPKKKTPLLREDLPDFDFWIGKPIAPGRPSRKDFLQDKKTLIAPVTSWIAGEKEDVDFLYDDLDEQLDLLRSPRGREGTDALIEILGTKAFNHPKPPTLMRNLVRQATGDRDIVLDFFAGSGTSAQAVLEQNKADALQGGRRFIMVSNTEANAEEPEKNICRDICARRVGNVINGYGATPGTGGNFAYLRCRRLAPERLTRIQHDQVWLALQMIHRDTLAPFKPGPFCWSGDATSGLMYVPRFRESDLNAIRKQARQSGSLILYSWEPSNFARHLTAKNIHLERIPESLARRFGQKG
jgi:adenine-specific DNA-methyltransferase